MGLINRNHLDPADVMTIDEIKTLLKRREISCPKVSSNESEANFHKRLIKVIVYSLGCHSRGVFVKIVFMCFVGVFLLFPLFVCSTRFFFVPSLF